MRKELLLGVGLACLGAMAACSADFAGGDFSETTTGDYSDETGDVDGEGPDGPDDGEGTAGTLTAGAWDDNRNYDWFLEYAIGIENTPLQGLPELTLEERDAANVRSQDRGGKDWLDIALVIDTTGSMGDEIAYLQAEFDALVSQIDEAYPDSQQRWALVVYRDDNDAYVVRTTDFTTDTDAFREELASHDADGGGDYPEASDQGLEAGVSLDWRAGSTARLLFWVADAPHHQGDEGRLAAAMRTAAESDVHIYPVASSGVDELTEYSMRSAAQLTLGRYLFLTDDSGVGGAHKEPSLPCYFVTRLDHAILRMVYIEISGVYREPAKDEIIRTGGEPVDGLCDLGDGEQAVVF